MLARRTVGRELCEFHASISSFGMSSSMVNRLELIHPLPASPSYDVCSGDVGRCSCEQSSSYGKRRKEEKAARETCQCLKLLLVCVFGNSAKARKVPKCVASLVFFKISSWPPTRSRHVASRGHECPRSEYVQSVLERNGAGLHLLTTGARCSTKTPSVQIWSRKGQIWRKRCGSMLM